MLIFKKCIVARIINETEIKNREKGQAKRKFGPGGSSSQGNRNFRRFKPGMRQDKGKQPAQWQQRKTCDYYGCQHFSPCRSITGQCFECDDIGHKVANCPKATWNNQGNIKRTGVGNNPIVQRGCPPAGASFGGNRSNKKPQAGGRVFCLEGEETGDPTNTVSGTLLINHLYTRILFDSCTTHSFVNYEFANKLVNKSDEVDI